MNSLELLKEGQQRERERRERERNDRRERELQVQKAWAKKLDEIRALCPLTDAVFTIPDGFATLAPSINSHINICLPALEEITGCPVTFRAYATNTSTSEKQLVYDFRVNGTSLISGRDLPAFLAQVVAYLTPGVNS